MLKKSYSVNTFLAVFITTQLLIKTKKHEENFIHFVCIIMHGGWFACADHTHHWYGY